MRLWLHTGHLHIEGRKMSKSLKNFVSVAEYFAAKNSGNPGDDFRLFCLQHRYSASLNYSSARIAEAAHYRAKVESFQQYVKALLAAHHRASSCKHTDSSSSSKVCSSRKSTAESLALEMVLQQAKDRVQAALCDDFDTPCVLRLLGDLVGEATAYSVLTLKTLSPDHIAISNSTSGGSGSSSSSVAMPAAVRGAVLHPVEPLLAVSTYIAHILSMFGLRFASRVDLNHVLVSHYIASNGASSDGGAGESGSGGDVSTQVVENILDFRSAVRQVGIQGTKNLKKMGKQQPAATAAEYQGELDRTLKALLQL